MKFPIISEWLHCFYPFKQLIIKIAGQLSVQRAILEVKEFRSKYPESVDAFCEEAIVRRELADNFCFYNEKYDSIKGAYDWAQKTLNDHRYLNFYLIWLLFNLLITFSKFSSSCIFYPVLGNMTDKRVHIKYYIQIVLNALSQPFHTFKSDYYTTYGVMFLMSHILDALVATYFGNM